MFRNVRGVVVDGSEAPHFQGNFFFGGLEQGLALRNTVNGMVTGNSFVATQGSSALSVLEGSLHSTLAHNLIMGPANRGILVSHGSHNTNVTEKLVWRSEGSGIVVSASDCVRIANNRSINNYQKGIQIRTSRNSAAIGNQLLGNGSAGIFIGDQPIETTTLVRSNTFIGNRFGLSTASASSLSLSGNNFSNQFPRFLEGDLASQTQRIVNDLVGAEPIELVASGVTILGLTPPTCQPWTES